MQIQVPADVRLLFCNDLKLETSALTGETEPIDYTAESAAPYVSVFDSHCVAFNGSLCHDGEALGTEKNDEEKNFAQIWKKFFFQGVVIRIGDSTVIGEIAKITGQQETRKTTLQVFNNFNSNSIKVFLQILIAD